MSKYFLEIHFQETHFLPKIKIVLSGSGAEMIVDNTSFALNQAFNITQFDIAAGNA